MKAVAAPLISVITVVLNREQSLEQAIVSVLSQQDVSREYIVIDGGSSDGTVGIIQRYADRLDYWNSTPDHGIADAMNRGIAVARGEWLLFLHSDDYLLDVRSLARAAARLDADADIVAFPIFLETGPKRSLHLSRGGGWWLNFKTGFYHQATFIRRSVFQQIGSYDVRFRLAMDYEFFLRARRRRVRMKTFRGAPISVMRTSGIGSRTDWPSLLQRFAEERAVHRLHARTLLDRMVYRLYWSAYFPFRWLRAHFFKHLSRTV